MPEPIIAVVDEDLETLTAVAGALARRFSPDYRVLTERSAAAAQDRLAAADDVPSRRNQVHPVAQRRRADHAVRIVREDRERARCL